MLPTNRFTAVASIVVALASLIYGIFDLSQTNFVLGGLKVVFAIFAAGLGVYFLRSRRVSERKDAEDGRPR
jgi:hypothetical protein